MTMTNLWSTLAVVITTCVASCSPAPAREASSSSSAATAQDSTATDVDSPAATVAASPKDKIAEEALASYVRELDEAGTACAIFGFQKALHTALYERKQGRGPQP